MRKLPEIPTRRRPSYNRDRHSAAKLPQKMEFSLETNKMRRSAFTAKVNESHDNQVLLTIFFLDCKTWTECSMTRNWITFSNKYLWLTDASTYLHTETNGMCVVSKMSQKSCSSLQNHHHVIQLLVDASATILLKETL